MSNVYVSSTFRDLQEHRRALEQALRRLGHLDIAMEHYTAENRSALQRCLDDVVRCDVYIGVFAWRYGWVPQEKNPDRLSITEMEYRHAIASDRPCLIFLLDTKAAWPPDLIDDDRSQIRKLRDELAGRHMAAFFTTPQDLAAAVTQAIATWSNDESRVFDFSHYFEALRRRFRRVDLDALTPPEREEYLQLELRSVFVEQNVSLGGPNPDAVFDSSAEEIAAVSDEPSPVLGFIADPRSRLTVILGNPGSGKSTLARYLLLSLADPSREAGDALRENFEGFVPFLIELRSYVALAAARKCETFPEYLEYLRKTESWGLRERAIDKYIDDSGKAFVIFDGIDEIFDPGERERVTQQIVSFAEAHPGARVIATSRLVGYRRRILAEAGFQHATLQDLDETQIETFTDRWYGLAMGDRPDEARDRRERLIKTWRDSPSMRQLAGNPLLLTIMAIIGKHQELPRERWKLYDHAASVLIQHWDVNKHLTQARIESDLIDEEDRKQLLRMLAFRMQGADGAAGGAAGNYVGRDVLQAVFARYIQDRYQADPVNAGRIARTIVDQFRERNFILSLYGGGLYGFVHRAFLEYFCASAYVFRFEKTHEISIENLKALFRQRWPDPSWHEVLRLICGMIGEKFAGEIIDDLLKVDSKPGEAREPWSVALAISCLGEVRNIAAIQGAARRTLSALLHVFDSPFIDRRFLRDELVTRAISIGKEWPPNPALADWIMARRRDATTWADEQLFGELIAAVAKSSENCRSALLGYLKLRPVGYRREAVYALAAGWSADPRTKPLLRKLIVSDPDGDVRAAAVIGLAQYFGEDPATVSLLETTLKCDRHWIARTAALYELAATSSHTDRTLHLLHDCAQYDSSERVRAAAGDALAEVFPREAVTLSLLLDRRTRANLEDMLGGPVPDLTQLIQLVKVHPDEAFREISLRVIAQHFSKQPEVFPLLRDRAVHDPRVFVRMCALTSLLEYFPDAPQTRALLRSSLIADPHPWGRATALNTIVEGFSRDARTLDLVRARAAADPDEFVREWAIDALGRRFLNEWRTLPFLCERLREEPDPYVRRRAAYSIAEYDDPRAITALAHARGFDPDESVRDACGFSGYGFALHHIVRHGGPSRKVAERPYPFVAWIMEILSNEPLDYYWKDGLDLLTVIGNDAKVHPRASVRSAVLFVIEHEFQSMPNLARDCAVNDSDPMVRIAALHLIARRREMRDEIDNAGVRLSRDVLPDCELAVMRDRALNDADGEVRAAAISSLASCDPAEPPDFFERIVNADADASARRAGVYGLGSHLEDETALAALCSSASGDPDARVRLAALDCLARSEATHAKACIRMRARSEPDPIAQTLAQEVIAWRSERQFFSIRDDSAALLDYVLTGESATQRLAAADRFRREFFGGWYEEDLESALSRACVQDEHASNRLEFMERLSYWFSRRPGLDALLSERAASDPAASVRDGAAALLRQRGRTGKR